MRVAVVGAGVGGLTLAIALQQRGVPVQVFEQARDLSEVGAGVALSGNSTRLLRRLGVGEELAAVSDEPSNLVIRHWKSGRIIASHPMAQSYRDAFGAPFWTLHRVDLQRVLSRRVDLDAIELGRRCTGVQQAADSMTLTFEDDSEAHADLVVGADGVRSEVRRVVLMARAPVFSGMVGYRGLVPVERLPSLPDRSPLQFWAGPRGHLLHYSIRGGEVINFLAVVRQREWRAEAWMEDCPVQDALAPYEGWHPAVLEMVGAVDRPTRWALFDHQPLDRWSVGRVVLLGDAAHAMLPHQGQGANQTIEDAVVLSDCVARASADDVASALDRYEAQRRMRTTQVQRYSRVTADCLHLPAGRAADMRDAGLGTLPADLAWIHGFDVQASTGRLDGAGDEEPAWVKAAGQYTSA